MTPATAYGYVLSDPVPQGQRWRLLLASLLFLAQQSNQSLYLFAISPTIAQLIRNSGVVDNLNFFSPVGTQAGVTNNDPPIQAAVQISGGGPSSIGTDITSDAGSHESVNGMTPVRFGGQRISLGPGWALLGFMNAPGGGGNAQLKLSVMFAALPTDCGPVDVLPPPVQKSPPVLYESLPFVQ